MQYKEHNRSMLLSTSDVLQLLPQERASSRLGDNSGFLLATCLVTPTKINGSRFVSSQLQNSKL